MPCREADFGSRAALRNLRRSLVGALAGRARVAEPCAARQAGLGDVPTLRGPWRLQVFARLTRASAPLKRRSRRPGGRRPSQGRCSFALRFTPKRREDPYLLLGHGERPFSDLDEWLRRRLRQVRWKEWKRYRTRRRNLLALGMPERAAREWAASQKGPWRVAGSYVLSRALPNAYWANLGLRGFTDPHRRFRDATRTA
jgi:hypothetical protein